MAVTTKKSSNKPVNQGARQKNAVKKSFGKMLSLQIYTSKYVTKDGGDLYVSIKHYKIAYGGAVPVLV